MKRWHIVTCEYPPQIGGVSDYTRLLGHQLVEAGDRVDIWAPAHGAEPEESNESGVLLHRTLGDFSQRYLARTGELIRKADPEQASTLLVQWVPHGYGRRAMNLGFCRWLEHLSKSGCRVWLMIHEPYLEFSGSWKQRLVALVHRRMIRTLLRCSSRVFISIPGWQSYIRPYAPAGKQFEWLPIPATVPVAKAPSVTSSIRGDIADNRPIIGHFGTYSAEVTHFLRPVLQAILEEVPEAHALLMGKNSERFAADLTSESTELKARIHASGLLTDQDLSHHLAACDLMLQPYPDGLSSRRTSLMNVLAHGVAVVSNSGHLTEDFWQETGAVALSKVSETHRLVEDSVRLLRDPGGRDRLAQAALTLYQAKFDWPKIIAALRSSSAAFVGHSK